MDRTEKSSSTARKKALFLAETVQNYPAARKTRLFLAEKANASKKDLCPDSFSAKTRPELLSEPELPSEPELLSAAGTKKRQAPVFWDLPVYFACTAQRKLSTKLPSKTAQRSCHA